MEERCLSCGEVLFQKTPLDEEGNWAMDFETELELEYDGNDSFYSCPHCSAKNVTILSTSPTGLSTLKIVRVKKD